MTLSPRDIANDDDLRSEFMRQVILSSARPPTNDGTSPRLLVQFWDEAPCVPSDVQTCLDSWASIEQAGFKRLLFGDATARRFIEDQFSARHLRAFDACAHPAMRADYFRLCFMLQVGGMYVDADDRYLGRSLSRAGETSRLQLQALCYHLGTHSMVNPYEAAEGGRNSSRVFYVNNNPLIAPAGHPLLARALERATAQIESPGTNLRDIQSLTGPGNLTACLVEHTLENQAAGTELDFTLIPDWDSIAVSTWPLEYRSDNRNWRNWGSQNA